MGFIVHLFVDKKGVLAFLKQAKKGQRSSYCMSQGNGDMWFDC